MSSVKFTASKVVIIYVILHIHYGRDSFVVFGETLVEASSPTNPLSDGSVLTLRCQFWNLEPNHIVTILRDVSAGSESLAWNGGLPQNADSRFYLDKREQTDSSIVYLLSITYASKEDAGLYSCQVLSNNAGQVTQIASDYVHIYVRYFPVNSKPICTPKDEVTLIVGSQVTLIVRLELVFRQ